MCLSHLKIRRIQNVLRVPFPHKIFQVIKYQLSEFIKNLNCRILVRAAFFVCRISVLAEKTFIPTKTSILPAHFTFTLPNY
jgi:hypothetical protein